MLVPLSSIKESLLLQFLNLNKLVFKVSDETISYMNLT